jgi:DNA-binding NarL/FixJ family response regulator
MASGDKELRCVIVDDDPRYTAIATKLLQRGGISIIGTASTIAEAVQRIEELRPDITLVDVNLGGESGLHLAMKLHQANSHAGLKIILTSAQSEQDFADLIAASPAVGFVPKDDLSPAAIHELLAASWNGATSSRSGADAPAAGFHGTSPVPDAPAKVFTDEEVPVTPMSLQRWTHDLPGGPPETQSPRAPGGGRWGFRAD